MRKVFGIVLLAVAILPISGVSKDSSPRDSAATKWPGKPMDWSHPKNYINLYEVTADGDVLPIYECRRFRDSSIDMSVAREVDVESKIRITFDRQWLLANFSNIEAAITVSARVKDRPVEVPGYSEVGQPTRVARSGLYMAQILNEWARALKRVDNILSEEFREFEATTSSAGKISSFQARENDAWFEVGEIDSSLAVAAAENSPQIGENAADSVARVAKISALRNKQQQLYNNINAVRDSLAILRAESIYVSDLVQTYIPRARARLLQEWAALRPSFELYADSSNAWVLDMYAKYVRRNPRVLVRLVQLITDQWIPALQQDSGLPPEMRLASSSSGANKYEQYRSIIEAMRVYFQSLQEDLDRLHYNDSDGGGVFDTSIVSLLKDTEILLARAQVKEQDMLILEVQNGPEIPELHRTFAVALKLGRFGLRHSLSDSFLFLKRLHAHESDFTNLAPGQSAAEPVNWEPAAGITFGWTLYVRSQDRRVLGLVTPLVRFLNPGFGINVSFPQFGSKLVVDDPNQSGRRLAVDPSTSDLGISAGPVLSFFDGAVQLTYGWMLSNVTEKRSYAGIGFSFIKGASKLQGLADER